MVICTTKTENERIPRNTKLSPETKSPTCEVRWDAAERGCVISLGFFSTVPKTHMHGASFEVWFQWFHKNGAFKF